MSTALSFESLPARVVDVSATGFDSRRASVTVTMGSVSHEISLASHAPIRRPANFGDVWLPLALIPAMATGSDLRLADPVSARLLANVGTVQKILSTWYPELRPVRVTAPVGRPRRRRARAHSAQFFTGGVDSFHTLQAHPEVETLVYVHDLIHEPAAVASGVSALLASVASIKDKSVVQIDSDVRTLLDPYGDWGTHTHGAALAAVAAFTSGTVSTMFFASTRTYGELAPWGSHPVLDHLWSGDSLEIVHDGAESSRLEKIVAISHDEVALQHLRVCWRTREELNCSVCEKCVRTMTSLEILGRLDDSVPFRGPLDLAAVSAVELHDAGKLSFSRSNAAAARAAGREDIAAAVETSISRYLAG